MVVMSWRDQAAIILVVNPPHSNSGGGKACQGKKTFLLSVSLLFFYFTSLLFDVFTRETTERERERACKRDVCAHEGEIHYSDNESIWDNMRQFTSPVVVFSIQEEDTFPAQSQRTSSGAAASLAWLPTSDAAIAVCRVLLQEHYQVCLFKSLSLSAQ